MRCVPFAFSGYAVVAACLLAGCAGVGGGAGPAVRVDGAVDRPASYSMSDLARRPAATQTVSFGSSKGPQTHTYTGTGLWALLSESGLRLDTNRKDDLLNRYVLASAADGYQVAFALAELSPDFGNQQSLVVYGETITGKAGPLPDPDGPFRVTAPGDVKGGRYVSMLTRLDVRSSGSAVSATGGGVSASLSVSGAVKKPVTLNLQTLQALPASNLTVGSTVYTGVSLWTVLSSVAGIQPPSAANNASLGMYAVATGSDGFKAVLSLGEIDPGFGNRQALLAYAANGADLGANGFARLVVPGDAKRGRSVSNLITIEVFTAPPAGQ